MKINDKKITPDEDCFLTREGIPRDEGPRHYRRFQQSGKTEQEVIFELLQDADLAKVSETSGVKVKTLERLRKTSSPISPMLTRRILLALDCKMTHIEYGKPVE
jgi:hypothetical protein